MENPVFKTWFNRYRGLIESLYNRAQKFLNHTQEEMTLEEFAFEVWIEL